MIDKKTEINILYDFYGELLTPRQKTILEHYYLEDLSFGEIAETMEISRQAVFDAVHKAERSLHTYEEKLGLVNRFLHHSEEIRRANREIDDIYVLLKEFPEASAKLDDVKQILFGLIDQEVPNGSV